MKEPQLVVKMYKPFENGMGNSLFRIDLTDYGEIIQFTMALFGYGVVVVYVKNPREFR